MKIVIASGKGGTGKSMLASSMCLFFSDSATVVACDCDVDAPNLGLWLGVTEYDNRKSISVSEKAEVNHIKCTMCGKCLESCRFEAVEKNDVFHINPLICEGCGVCRLICPSDAIDLKEVRNGELRITNTRWGFPLVSGQVYPGATGSGKIVQKLREKAEEFKHDIMVLDSAAGIGCPVIASITGCDYAVLVTEPTPSGFTDMKRILEVLNHFQIPFGVVVNKWNINPRASDEIENWSGKQFLGKVSYDREVINSIVNLKPVVKLNSEVSNEIKNIFKTLRSVVEKQ
jgi:MinD superfamily P-loop ATPase